MGDASVTSLLICCCCHLCCVLHVLGLTALQDASIMMQEMILKLQFEKSALSQVSRMVLKAY